MLNSKRKIPVQERSIQTVETLLESAVQVLEKEGGPRFTTNRVAEIAGFSIGTLYQYFPSKDAIVEALIRRECIRVECMMRTALQGVDANNLDMLIRKIVQTMINALDGKFRARRFLIVQGIRMGLAPAASMLFTKIERVFLDKLKEQSRHQVRPLSEAASFVLSRALASTIRIAVLEESALLRTREFEDELVRLASGFIRPEPSAV
jgi:AcrR family transcriptional regulator